MTDNPRVEDRPGLMGSSMRGRPVGGSATKTWSGRFSSSLWSSDWACGTSLPTAQSTPTCSVRPGMAVCPCLRGDGGPLWVERPRRRRGLGRRRWAATCSARSPRHRCSQRRPCPWLPSPATSAYEVVCVSSHRAPTELEDVIVGPLVALIRFVCSIGNVPLAAALSKGGPASSR